MAVMIPDKDIQIPNKTNFNILSISSFQTHTYKVHRARFIYISYCYNIFPCNGFQVIICTKEDI